MVYTLSEDEADVAALIANKRNTLNNGGTNIPGGETASDEERLYQHYVACMAEIGTSRILNLSWSGCGKGSLGLPDVGNRFEVRSITDKNRGLLVRDKDKKDSIYILVYVNSDKLLCELLGWETAANVVRLGRVLGACTEKPCYILPVKDLLSVDLLV